LEENGSLTRPPIEMKDGWALDTSMSLPHLDRVLQDSEEIISERSGQRRSSKGAYLSFFQNVWTEADLMKYPSFLDFVTSSDVLSVVSHYSQCVPVLSTTKPQGIGLLNPMPLRMTNPTSLTTPSFIIDYFSLPNVYILVVLRDTTIEHGPSRFCRAGFAKSPRAPELLSRQRRDYHLSDEDIYSVVDRKEVIEFCYPRGTVLFIESSGCFHYGSRNSIKPRFLLLIGYHGACRTDFSEVIMPHTVYPVRDTDSRLRKMVLNKNMFG
jgi:hypothetical protein